MPAGGGESRFGAQPTLPSAGHGWEGSRAEEDGETACVLADPKTRWVVSGR